MEKIQIFKRHDSYWLEINDISNAVDFLEKTNIFLEENYDSKWKWSSIALHGALYGFSILAIKGTNPFNAPPEGTGIYDIEKEWLIPFDKALKYIQDVKRVNPPVSISKSQKKNIDKMSAMLRNNFFHFSPNKHESINLTGICQIFDTAIDVIDHLIFKTSSIRLDDDVQEYIMGLLQKIRLNLKANKFE